MIEEELRATFARHEELAPPVGPLRTAIDRIAARRRRRRLTVRTTGAALAVLAVVGIPVLGRGLVPAPAQVEQLAEATSPPAGADGALNFLLLGVEGQDQNNGRADSVLIVHVPRDRSRAYLVSIPRDLAADIPGHGVGKLSESFQLGSTRSGGGADLPGGARLTAQTVTGLTGLTFDGTGVLTFDGLRQLTDAVGGVELCLPAPVQSLHTRRIFPAGCQRLDGAAAIDLLRQRYALPVGAHDRDRNAQRFASALAEKMTSTDVLTNPVRVSKILQAVGDGLVTDIGKSSLASLLPTMVQVAGAEPVGIGWNFDNAPTDSSGSLSLDPAAGDDLFAALRGDTLPEWVKAHPDRVTR
ncbi:LCP family protein [Micromonospora sp. NBC_01796]|uniref:LCP family protein n=1 Tax=Micromonospora sp. NBC_01796 TaxID=2975987 RepID=UPI002DD85D12|nr:LCP family protein [Micromonospora sp. NBC_01796]WSA88722.1 LCP family protein [Micromonospora sp. NBC_01796]